MPEPFTAEERNQIAQVIDPLDPLLAHFTLQHDLRERYLHALEEIKRELAEWKQGVEDIEWVDIEWQHDQEAEFGKAALEKLTEIVTDAIDIDKLREWTAAGRPMPWLDEKYGEPAARLTAEIVRMINGQVEGVPGLVEAAEADGVVLEPRVDGEWPGDSMAGSDEQAVAEVPETDVCTCTVTHDGITTTIDPTGCTWSGHYDPVFDEDLPGKLIAVEGVDAAIVEAIEANHEAIKRRDANDATD